MSQHHKAANWHGGKTRKARANIAAMLPAPCVECGRPVYPDDPWDVGHIIPLAHGGNPNQYGPAHRKCNRSAGGTLGAQKINRQRKQSRQW